MTGAFRSGTMKPPQCKHNYKVTANTSVFVICQHRTSSGLSDPQFINSSAEMRLELTYSVSLKSATTKGFL
jgi:hypothetical protein